MKILINVDSEGRVTEGDTFYGRVLKDLTKQVTWQGKVYPTYEAVIASGSVGHYRENRQAVFAVVLGTKLPSSL